MINNPQARRTRGFGRVDTVCVCVWYICSSTFPSRMQI